MRTLLTVLFAITCFLGMAGIAQALVVTNGASALFDSGGFEGYSTGEAPPAASGWVTSPDDPGSNVNKVVPAPDGVVPAYEGSNMLWERRYLNGWDRVGWAAATFASQTSGTVTAEFAFYVPTAGLTSAAAYLAFKSSGDAESAWKSEVALLQNGTVKNYGSGWALQDTGLTFDFDAWNTMTMSYNINTGTTALTINGITASGLWSVQGAGVTIDRVYLGTGGSNSVIYYDSVPEPATMALLGLGGLLGFYRRKA